MKKLFTILTLGLLLIPTLNAQPPVHRPLRIMVGQEGGSNTGEMQFVSASLSSSLSKYCGTTCIVVEPGDEDTSPVDAYLRGNVGTVQRCGDCRPYVTGAMRLVSNDGVVIWSNNVKSSNFSRDRISSFTDNTAKQLVKYLEGR